MWNVINFVSFWSCFTTIFANSDSRAKISFFNGKPEIITRKVFRILWVNSFNLLSVIPFGFILFSVVFFTKKKKWALKVQRDFTVIIISLSNIRGSFLWMVHKQINKKIECGLYPYNGIKSSAGLTLKKKSHPPCFRLIHNFDFFFHFFYCMKGWL